MSGQGSPLGRGCPAIQNRSIESATRSVVWSWALLRFVSAVAAFAILVLADNAQASPQNSTNETDDRAPIKIRCQWGGGQQRAFVGSIEIVEGRLVGRSVLSLSVDAAATSQRQGDSLRIQHLQPTAFGGADLLIVPSSDIANTKVLVELSSVEAPDTTAKFSVSVKQLVENPAIEMLDDTGNRISLVRLKSDQIQIDVKRPHLVFEPNESWRFRWRPNDVSFSSEKAKGTLELRKSGSSRRLKRQPVSFSRMANGDWEWEESKIDVPNEEGVYQLTLHANQPWYRPDASSDREKPIRIVEFIVLARSSQASTEKRWKVLQEIDLVDDFDHDLPDQKTLDDKRRLFPPIPMLGFGPSLESLSKRLEKKQAMGNDRRSLLEYDGGTLLNLHVAGWQTIPVQFENPDKPYAIEIDYLVSGPLSIGFSLLEQDRDGQVTSDGFDSGVFLPESIVKDPNIGQIQTHRFTVWPATEKSHLLLVNRHRKQAVSVKAIRVLSGGDRLPAEPRVTMQAEENRQLIAMVENIDFKREYNSHGDVDPKTGQQLDDWRSFYVATDRLIQHLKAGGFEGAYLTVMSDGTALFPSSLVDPSPRCDSGVFYEDGRDPIRKDVLEMILRMFEREGLKLIPMLAFNGTLPEIERLRTGERESSFELVSRSGTRHRFGTDPGLPGYNPLDVRVQRAVERIVAELGDRYRGSSALGGISLACRPDTYTLLPGSRWGYDKMTIANFVQQNVELKFNPADSAIEKISQFQGDWNKWRCQKMSDWYDRMGQTLAQQSSNTKLYIAPIDLYRNSELATQLAPNLHRTIDFKKLLLQIGLTDLSPKSNGSSVSNVVRLIPHRLAFDRSTIQQRSSAAVKNSKQIDSVFRSSGFSGDLFHHRGQWAHFLQLQKQKPFANQKNPLIRMQRLGPGQQFGRQRLVEAIKKQDSPLIVDGGWQSLASDSGSDQLRHVFRQLPRQPFENVRHQNVSDVDSLPIVVRQLELNGKTYFYVTNASPWQAKVKLQRSATQSNIAKQIESFSDVKFVSSAEQPGVVEVVLPPFGLVGGVCESRFDINFYTFDWNGDVANDLRKRIFALQLKLQQSLQVPSINVLKNPDFSLSSAGGSSVDGWEIGSQLADKFTPMEESKQATRRNRRRMQVETESFMRMRADGNQVTWIRSHPIKSPQTGRLSISVLLRSAAEDPVEAGGRMPAVRVAVDGRAADSDYYRYGVVGTTHQSPQNGQQMSGGWKRFAVHFDDLPDQLNDLRIGFDVMGEGAVDIAKVRLYDRWFDEKDARAITQLLASADVMSLQSTRFDRCRRLLEEYWAVFLNEYFSLQSLPRNANQRVPMFQKRSRLLNR